MLKTLLKLRLAAVLGWLTGMGRKKSRPARSPVLRVILMGLLLIYVVGCFCFLFLMWFDTFAQAWAGTELDWLYFAMYALTGFALMFFFSIFTAKEQLFEAKDNDLLLSMPLTPGSILLSRLTGLAVINLLFELPLALPVAAAWMRSASLSGTGWLALILTTLLLPLFALAFSALFGWALAAVSRHVRRKALFSTVFSLAFLALYFYFYSKVNRAVEQLADNGAAAAERLSAARPLYWLGQAIARGDLKYLLLTAVLLLLPFLLVCLLLSRTFFATVTARPSAPRVEYKAGSMQTASPEQALFRRELSAFTASSSYMVNAGLGVVLLAVGAAALPFLKDKLYGAVSTANAPEGLLLPLLLLAVCAVICTVTITAASVSVEGGSLWIAQSLPVSSWQVLQAKLQLQQRLTLPPALLAGASVAWLTRPEAPALAACFLLPAAFVLFQARLGLIANLRHPNLNWTSESQAVKNGASIIITMLLGWGLLLLISALTYGASLLLPLGWGLLIVAGLLLAAAWLAQRWLMRRGAAIYADL